MALDFTRVTTEGLTKMYGLTRALSGVDLAFDAGKVSVVTVYGAFVFLKNKFSFFQLSLPFFLWGGTFLPFFNEPRSTFVM